MKTIAFFNNKGGVGKTSLVFHLAYMFSELDMRVLVADLDPQANLTGMFLDEDKLIDLWENETQQTIDGGIAPLFDGLGDITSSPHIVKIGERIGLLAGSLTLSQREDELSEVWPKCQDRVPRAFRVTTAIARLIANANKAFDADLILIDVGPNLGALNRAAMIASDYVVIPLAPDLFSLQGLKNVGPTLQGWRKGWSERKKKKPDGLEIDLPAGNMQPLGYVIMRHSARLGRPVQAFLRWIEKIPQQYYKAFFRADTFVQHNNETDPNLLAHLKDYRSLMPLAQEANKPMFMLKPADGIFGANMSAVRECYDDFKALAEKIKEKLDVMARPPDR